MTWVSNIAVRRWPNRRRHRHRFTRAGREPASAPYRSHRNARGRDERRQDVAQPVPTAMIDDGVRGTMGRHRQQDRRVVETRPAGTTRPFAHCRSPSQAWYREGARPDSAELRHLGAAIPNRVVPARAHGAPGGTSEPPFVRIQQLDGTVTIATAGARYDARMRESFVLTLGDGTEPADRSFAGWIEHVATGQERRFRSTDELLAFLAECITQLQSNRPAHSDGRTDDIRD